MSGVSLSVCKVFPFLLRHLSRGGCMNISNQDVQKSSFACVDKSVCSLYLDEPTRCIILGLLRSTVTYFKVCAEKPAKQSTFFRSGITNPVLFLHEIPKLDNTLRHPCSRLFWSKIQPFFPMRTLHAGLKRQIFLFLDMSCTRTHNDGQPSWGRSCCVGRFGETLEFKGIVCLLLDEGVLFQNFSLSRAWWENPWDDGS